MKTDCHDCCYPENKDSRSCGCCEGVEPLTPLSTANRPGLSELSYRIGSHSSFLETMIARLSSHDSPELARLSTRDPEDPSIALLDGWATVADVLTFYQERIANEGYLRCATERRSVLELARLVGYKLRPGVSSSVFMAYTIDENTEGETTIPAGSRAQSIPGPDELPQSFETSEDLKARATWNNLKPRLVQPQTATSIMSGLVDSNITGPRVYLKGVNTNLKANDLLLVQFGSANPLPHRVREVITDAEQDHTLIMLHGSATTDNSGDSYTISADLIKDLTLKPSLQPRDARRLRRKLANQFSRKADTGYRTLGSFTPKLKETLSRAAANTKATPDTDIKIYALRSKASLFGHNAPREPQYSKGTPIPQPWPEWKTATDEAANRVYLDVRYDEILPDSYIVIDQLGSNPAVFTGEDVQFISRSAYGMGGETTRIELDGDWWAPGDTDGDGEIDTDISPIRNSAIYVQSELMELADEPIKNLVCGGIKDEIELDGFYEGLESGRWVIVSGERDLPGTSGVRFSELAMLSSVTQDIYKEFSDGQTIERLGEKIHTFIKLAEELEYCFKRDTVKIYGNVVKATHGETRNEVLGSGDGSKSLQSFDLKQSPVTYVSASNPAGAESSLNVYVNDIKWHEMDTLAGLVATDRNFVSKADDDSKTTVTFGNGREGARLPTGMENIRAVYRNGIGKEGNVRAEQISLLATKPLGVKEVINPLRASGGADRENRDQARKSAPLAVKALDRLVSVQDYKDFSRLYAGIGKSDAVEISNGRQQLVHVTIAGADDIPIDKTSDLFINLLQALRDFGDPHQPVQLAVRELLFIVISANIKIKTDYLWEPVVTELRTTLLETFGFEQRELGQDVVLSEVISVMQAVPGVEYVDIDAFVGIPEKIPVQEEEGGRRLLTPDEVSEYVTCMTTEWSRPNMDVFCKVSLISSSDHGVGSECEEYLSCKKFSNFVQKYGVDQRIPVNMADYEQGTIRPAQIAILSPDVPDTLILNQIK